MTSWKFHERIILYIISPGIYGVARLGTIVIDSAFVTALVER